MRKISCLIDFAVFGVLVAVNASIGTAGPMSPGAVSPSTAGTPVAYLQIDTSSVLLPIGGGKISTTTYSSVSPPVVLSAIGNRDPYIIYNLSFTNTSASDEFLLFAFGIPIVPHGDNSSLSTDLEVTLVDGGDSIVSLIPTYDGTNASSGLQRALLSSDGGATFMQSDEFGPLGGTITTPGTSTYSFGQSASASPPSVIYNYLELLVGFNLSPGDTVIFHGNIAIAVPEPSTLALSLTCLGALVVYRRAIHRHALKPANPASRQLD